MIQVRTEQRAAELLNMATFGATKDSVQELLAIGDFEAWIDAQLQMPLGQSHVDGATGANQPPSYGNLYGDPAQGAYRITAEFWTSFIQRPDQLRQRVSAALLEIFVINAIVAAIGAKQNRRASASYVDMLERNAFGDFRQLLEDVSLHPAMGHWLSHIDNKKAEYGADGVAVRNPDENYAREILQLFSIGLFELSDNGEPKTLGAQPIESYNQDDIVNLARVFTGWGYDPATPGAARVSTPMVANAGDHSPEAKRFLGFEIPANTGPEESLRQALDFIAAHQNVGPFIGKLLIQRLVTSNPSPDYVQRVTNVFANNGSGQRGDMAAVVKAILTDPEAISSDSTGKLREPMMRLCAVARFLGAEPARGNFIPFGNLSDIATGVGQSPLMSPSVFNFFRPGFTPPGSDLAAAGLLAPEFQICSGTQIIGSINTINRIIDDPLGLIDYTNFDYLEDLAANPRELVDHCVDHLVGEAGAANRSRKQITQIIGALPDSDRRERVKLTVKMVVSHPGFIVQR